MRSVVFCRSNNIYFVQSRYNKQAIMLSCSILLHFFVSYLCGILNPHHN
uniref:Uncharacterized protein n=1 Tax=Lepeophtheirus salmonis TaxID=72036 RepID=A0A0K2SZZ3_LEPSM